MSEPVRRIPPYLEDLVVRSESRRETSAYDAPAPPARPVPEIKDPKSLAFLERLMKSTPAKVVTGRTGTRYRTDTYLSLRGDHAIAKDAVTADLPGELAGELDCILVTTRCPDRAHYLLHPNDGRRLSDESRRRLEQEGAHDVDVQVILADGLAAPALQINGPRLLPALLRELRSRNLAAGRPILASMARVGLQDDIGVLLNARATLICLGERPGLGTGDSLSIYLAVAPKLDQDNAEKNCISNIRPQGMSPEAAAEAAAVLVARGLELGRSGLDLV
ncbi:MAG: ethanolamine ammonia-lyase subunit EutC [Myxococcota bacterium]